MGVWSLKSDTLMSISQVKVVQHRFESTAQQHVHVPTWAPQLFSALTDHALYSVLRVGIMVENCEISGVLDNDQLLASIFFRISPKDVASVRAVSRDWEKLVDEAQVIVCILSCSVSTRYSVVELGRSAAGAKRGLQKDLGPVRPDWGPQEAIILLGNLFEPHGSAVRSCTTMHCLDCCHP